METPICRTHRSNADKSTTRGDVAIVAISCPAIRYGFVARLDYVNIKDSKRGRRRDETDDLADVESPLVR